MQYTSLTPPSLSASKTADLRDISNPEKQDTWFDNIDYVEMDETWFGVIEHDTTGATRFDVHDSHHANQEFAGKIADYRVPFTEDCRCGLQQFIRILGEYEESSMFSACLEKILPGIPGSLAMAASSLYSAIIEHRNIDMTVLHTLGLASWYLPDDINIVSQLAAFIRDTVTGWTDETFLQQLLGSEENHTSTCLFTALAVTAIAAGRCMQDERTPQHTLLRVPAFVANIIIRVHYYWEVLENMPHSAPPSNGETRETAEQASPEKAALREIAPDFEQIVSLGTIGMKVGNNIVNLMSNNKKTTEPAQEIASSHVPDPNHEMHEDTAIEKNVTNNNFITIEVKMAEVITTLNPAAILSTSGLSDCSALAILSDWNGSIYETRTLMHLLGSNLAFPLNYWLNPGDVISELKENLADGGKVIWVGGTSSQSNIGLEIAIGQFINDNDQPIFDLLMTKNVSVEISGSHGVMIYPNGNVKLEDGTGRGFLREIEKQDLLESIAIRNDLV